MKRSEIEEAQRLLGACSLFNGLEKEERRTLVERAKLRSFSAGQTIFSMGSPGNSMMAVLSGSIRISIPSASGKELVLAILKAGQIFGEIALLDGKERTADATAATDCRLAVLERSDVLALLDRHPSAWLKVVEVLCDRLRRTDQQISELALLQLPVRLAKTLLRLAEDSASSSPHGIEIQFSQRELGNFVGATRESVNKCLGDWQRAGILHIEENVIVLTDRASLQALASIESER
ncbi:MAG TPA: Crp/Fnr family transcriptional regulator [Xanthobacteraceae bacterium]|nr:Crp/Fnr family transcriptional regulator [Xanthobacteraceae bacterium]